MLEPRRQRARRGLLPESMTEARWPSAAALPASCHCDFAPSDGRLLVGLMLAANGDRLRPRAWAVSPPRGHAGDGYLFWHPRMSMTL
jgi:hypothetical protein